MVGVAEIISTACDSTVISILLKTQAWNIYDNPLFRVQ